jgi:hypothetical protein
MAAEYEDDDLDGCDDEHGLLGEVEPMPDDHVEVFPLFAEALDPESPVTVADVERQWSEIREAGGL